MAATYSIIGCIGMMALIAVGFSAMTKTIVALTPKPAAEYTTTEIATYNQAFENWERQQELTSPDLPILSYTELRDREMLESQSIDLLSSDEQGRLRAMQGKKPAASISHIRDNVLVWIVCIVVMLYAVVGGLEAAFLTDTIQGLFIILLSVLLIPFAWEKVNEIYGGSGMIDALRTIHTQLPVSTFEMFGSPHSIDFTWYYIMAISAMAILTVPVYPNMLVACGSAKNEYASRYGFTVGNFLKRICTVFWGVFGLAAIVIYTGKVSHPDLIWGYATRDLLAPLGLGLVGLMISCLMAALMSTVDCMMLTSSSLLTHNLYTPIFPGRSQRHYVWIGRVFGAAVVIGGAWIALQFETILQILKFVWEVNVVVMPAFWLGMKWRRANAAAAWTSIVVCALVFLILPVLGPLVFTDLRTSEYLAKTTDPQPLSRSYTVREADLLVRNDEIKVWDTLDVNGQARGARPEALNIGETFKVQYTLPRKSIFWTQGLTPDANGQSIGRGALNLELLLLDAVGFDLSANPYAMNETIRIVIRLTSSLLIMLSVSLLTRADDNELIGRFFAKMRTKVLTDHDADAQEVALSMEDPRRYEDLLLFPNSNWELLKGNREDWVGFLIAIAGVGGVLLLMTFLVNLGG